MSLPSLLSWIVTFWCSKAQEGRKGKEYTVKYRACTE